MPALTCSFPGHPALGRGLVLSETDDIPEGAEGWPTLTIDPTTLSEPAAALETLDRWWRSRTPSVVVLGVPFAALKAIESTGAAPHTLAPDFEFARERTHFLVWANRYDGRGGPIRWHHGERALRLGAAASSEADVAIDGAHLWVDGGPRTHDVDGLDIIHVEAVWSDVLELDRRARPSSELAPDQLAAVEHPGGPARIIAPAGSGKTRVLTERLRHLIIDRRWNPDSITALAYNRRAAEEMRQRLDGVGSIHVRTIHAFGYEIVGRANGGDRPRLLGEMEVRRILDRLTPVKPRANEDVHAPYIEALSEVRTALRPPHDVEMERDDVPGFAELFDTYRSVLRSQRAIDHDEQIYGALEALLGDPALRGWAQARCRHLLVDEFQDLTPAHLLMVRLLSAPSYDTFGVGDDDQVIYGYAGASPEFLVDYHRFFPGSAHHQLEVNYRCPAPVVEAASKLLAHNRRRVPKVTRSASTTDGGLEVVKVAERDMGEALVSVVQGLVDRTGAASVAVLTRVNVGLLVPQVSLLKAGIAADHALDENLLSRSGVRAALAWLRIAATVAAREPIDGPDLSEAVRRPPRSLSPGVRTALGRGAWTVERLASFTRRSDDPRTRGRLEDLVGDIGSLARLTAQGATVAARLTHIRDQIGLGTVLDRLDNSRARPTGGHTDDLDALIVLAHTHPEVEAFEAWLRSTLGQNPPSGPRVTLSTVHRVKGLEWPHVVVWDATVGLMPHRLATDIEEERRIFHVAITRCSESVTIIGRAEALSPFAAQIFAPAPPPPVEPTATAPIHAAVDLDLTWQGFAATVIAVEPEGVIVSVGSASRMRVRWGETVVASGRRGRLVAPTAPPVDQSALGRLKEWRRERASADGVPPYVIAHDAHLVSIATLRPTTLEELARCEGIGPSRLDRYGADILDVLD
ncbi:hypothetical protein BH23ACT5_BH23ACT5_07700 [soil metagenome]